MSIRRRLVPLLLTTMLLSACSAKPAHSPNTGVADQHNPVPVVPAATTSDKPTPTAEQPVVPTTGDHTPPPPPSAQKRSMPKEVRGIVVTGWISGTVETVENLLSWAEDAGINTVVVDVKAEDGLLSWKSDIPIAKEIGSNEAKIADFPAKIEQFRRHHMWVIGRIVVMNDQYLYKARPAARIPGFDGGPYSFLDPKSEIVREYNLAIVEAAIAAGVDEIQFDYIRYPEKLIPGYNGKDTTFEQRTSAIQDFLGFMVKQLKPKGVYVSADVFGLTTSVSEGDDMEIGQDYRKIAETVDFISPMAYPSHYAPGTYGINDPNSHPYETVKRSMEKALARTPGIPLEKHRPWIQDFTMGHHYGKAEVEAQIQALSELGIKSYLLWDPLSKFTRDVDHHGR